MAVVAAVLDEEGVEIEEEADAEGSKAPSGSRRRDVDEEVDCPVPYAAAAGKGQQVPSDLVPAQHLVHFAPSQVISVHLDAVGKCCVSYFALESCFRSGLVSEGEGVTVVVQEEWSKKQEVMSAPKVLLVKSR